MERDRPTRGTRDGSVNSGHEQKDSSKRKRIAPTKVMRTSRLPVAGKAVQQRTVAKLARKPHSLAAWTTDSMVDTALRGMPLPETGQIQARADSDVDAEEVHRAADKGVQGSGAPLPHFNEIQQSFGPSHDLSSVQAHIGGAAADACDEMGALAYASGSHVAFKSAPDLHTTAHEAAHIVQQRSGVQLQDGVGRRGDSYECHADRVADAVVAGRSAASLLAATDTREAGAVQADNGIGSAEAVQQAAPAVVPIVIWLGKAVAATTIDAFIDAAIATILALPTPGALDNIINFLINLVPGLGEAKKVKKAGKLIKVVDDIIDTVRDMKRLNVPGAPALVKNLSRESSKLKAALESAELDNAKAIFQRMLGYLREAQIASKVKGQGDELVALGMGKVGSKKLLTDIDVVFKQGDEVIFGQVKAGKAANFGRDSGRWAEFENQARRTVEAAQAYAGENKIATRVKYFVDDISDEARDFLKTLDIDVVSNQSFLN